MWKNMVVGLCLVGLALAVAWQGRTIRELRHQLALPAAEQSTPDVRTLARTERIARAMPSATHDGLPERVTSLEQTVAQLTQASEYLMTRGQLPLASHKIAEMEQKVLDPNASERDRLQALRALRRGGAMSDAMVQHTLSWIQRATNNGLREDLLEQLEGSTNAFLPEPMIKLAGADPNPDVREQAVQNLRRFVDDPRVESLLWNLVRNDSDGGVREEAEEALTKAPMTDARRTAMRARALDSNSSLDERLLAVRALRDSGDAAAEATAALAKFVQTSQNPQERARVFGAFDGSSDPNMKLPLVYGLQDPSPIVRERAADALSGYKADPAVVQWLKHVAESDADPRVRREASQALNDRR